MSKNNMRILHTRELTYTALFTALIAVLSQLSIPMPSGVPISLQTFAIALAGFFLGPFLGLSSAGVYVLLGAVGLPVFSNFGSGAARIFGLTGGFIFGFLPFSFLCGVALCLEQKRKTRAAFAAAITLSLLGLAICHFGGIVQFSLVSKNSFVPSALLVSVPYLPKDILSLCAAYFLAKFMKKKLSYKVN